MYREHPRIAFLKDFATFLRNNQSNSLPAIKIAIIDDGLDSSFDILKTNYTHIAAGAAFCSAETNNIRSYYIPSGDHGARVASLICSICPRTALYIAKIEHEVERSGVTQINIQSATKVSDRRFYNDKKKSLTKTGHRQFIGQSSEESTLST